MKTLRDFRQWLLEQIDFMEGVLLHGPCHVRPDGQVAGPMYTTLVVEEIVEEATRLACRYGFDPGDVPAMPTPRAALALLCRLEKWARENVPDTATLTVSEAARLLRVKRDTVLAWVNSGQLPAMNTGQGRQRPRYRIARTDLDGFLDQRTPKPVAEPAKPGRRVRVKATGLHGLRYDLLSDSPGSKLPAWQ